MIWKPIKYGDGYELSEFGDVRRTKTKWKNKHVKGTLLSAHSNGHKYMFVVLTLKKCVYKRFYVHRLVCEHFNGPAPTEKHEVAHYDSDPTNNHFSNLRWVTRQENHICDRYRNKTLPGQENYGKRLWME